jgi:hypothetical protein
MTQAIPFGMPSKYNPRSVAVRHERDPTDRLVLTKASSENKKDEKTEADVKAELNALVEKTSKCLIKVSTVFPFDFFPDFITVDANQVNIVIREFFWSERRHSIHIRDILDIFVDTSLFFSTIRITDKSYTADSTEIKFLKRKDAIKLRSIIQGLIVAHRSQLDLSKIEPHELLPQILELGKVKEME